MSNRQNTAFLAPFRNEKSVHLIYYLLQIIRNFGSIWLIDDSDPQGEINIAVKMDNGTIMFPVQRCIKRFQNGAEDSIYAYVYVLKAKS